MNEFPIIEAGFIQPLIDLLALETNEDVQYHGVSILRNLAGGSEESKRAICKTSTIESIKKLVLEAPMKVQSEVVACITILAHSSAYPPLDRHI